MFVSPGTVSAAQARPRDAGPVGLLQRPQLALRHHRHARDQDASVLAPLDENPDGWARAGAVSRAAALNSVARTSQVSWQHGVTHG